MHFFKYSSLRHNHYINNMITFILIALCMLNTRLNPWGEKYVISVHLNHILHPVLHGTAHYTMLGGGSILAIQ